MAVLLLCQAVEDRANEHLLNQVVHDQIVVRNTQPLLKVMRACVRASVRACVRALQFAGLSGLRLDKLKVGCSSRPGMAT